MINEYYSDGKLEKSYIEGVSSTEITRKYNIFGALTELDDSQRGKITYDYDGFGQLIMREHEGDTVKYTYDLIGRKLTRTENEGTTKWFYDNKPNGVGLIDSISGPENSKSFFYDNLGRLIKSTDNIDNERFVTKNTFDEYSRQKTLTYPSGFKINYEYNDLGFIYKVIRDSDQKTLWKANNVNAKRQLEEFTLGNGLETTNTFEGSTGLTIGIVTNNQNDTIQNLAYSWGLRSQLMIRKDNKKQLLEKFSYDNLIRLTSNIVGNDTVNLQYDDLGNITYKSDVGNYVYGENGANPYQLTSINNNQGSISDIDQFIKYTSFNKVKEVIQGSDTLLLSYGFNHNRVKQVIKTVDGVKSTKIYLGGLYEKDSDVNRTKLVHYLKIGGGLFAIYSEYDDNFKETHYVHKDHLGSLHSLSNESATLIEEYAYDSWGQRRDPNTWQVPQSKPNTLFARGFTGHEHIDLFDLINMNGRVYDPIIGRFISPDPFIQDIENPQNYNRYAYCLNNPLSATDPTGYNMDGFFRILRSMFCSVMTLANPLVGAMAFTMNSVMSAKIEGASTSDALKAGFFTSLSSIGSFGVGKLFEEAGKWGKEIARALSHGVVQGGIGALQGGKFQHGFIAASIGSLAGSFSKKTWGLKKTGNKIISLMLATAAGGTASVIGGGKFGNGAMTAAFVNLLNCQINDEEAKGIISKANDIINEIGEKIVTFGLGIAKAGEDFAAFAAKLTTIDGIADYLENMATFFHPSSVDGQLMRIDWVNKRLMFIRNIPNMSGNEIAFSSGYVAGSIGISYITSGGGSFVSSIRNFKMGYRSYTLYKPNNNFRIDFDTNWFLHYHRRGAGGIGRHRPWQVKPGDQGNFWKRF